jgi:hypothetical protein
LDQEEFRAFWRSRTSLSIRLAISGVGALLLIHGLSQGIGRSWLELAAAVLLLVVGLGDAMHPIFNLTPEGLVIVRGGFRGTDKLIRWTSIRGMQRMGDRELSLELLDQSWTRLKVGPLSAESRDSLIEEITRRASHG